MILLVLGCPASSTNLPPAELVSSEVCEACGGGCELDTFAESTRDHVDAPIVYADPPPTNGDHNPCWAEWGVHEEEVPDENWVHNLEHGGVVFLYQCPEGCAAEADALAAWAGTLEAGRWIVTPYAEMEWAFAATAWNHRVLLDCLDLDALQAFYDGHVGRAPEDTTASPSGCM